MFLTCCPMTKRHANNPTATYGLRAHFLFFSFLSAIVWSPMVAEKETAISVPASCTCCRNRIK